MDTNILDFGAVAGGEVLCTKAIQAAIDEAAASGGGRVTVPAGLYLTGSIWLRDNVELHLSHGSTLKASENMDDYNEIDAYPQNLSSPVNEKWVGKHLLIALECENVALTGTGVIDGSGDAFFDPEPRFYSVHVWRDGLQEVRPEKCPRPGQLLAFIECRRVLVENVTLRNQPCWGCFLHGCEYVTVRGLQTRNPHSHFNSDGIDIDCCRFVTVSDCIFDTGDDCIAIRGSDKKLKNRPKPCEYITVTNCVLGSCSNAIRLGVGNSAIRHVRISNLVITRGAPAVTLQSSYHGNGCVSIEDVRIAHVSAMDCSRPFEILEGANVPIRDVVLEDFVVETSGYFHLHSDFADSVRGITLRHWNVTVTTPPVPTVEKDILRRGTVWFRAENIKGLRIEDFHVCDPEGHIAANWPDGVFAMEGCDDRRLTDVTVNGVETN